MSSFALFWLGACLGSYMGHLADSWNSPEAIWLRRRSSCDWCGKVIPVFCLIPLMSWIFLRGKTLCCGSHLSIQHPVREAIVGAALVINHLVYVSFDPWIYGGVQVFTLLGIAVAFIDWKTYRIPVIGLALLVGVAVTMGSSWGASVGMAALMTGIAAIITRLWKKQGLPLADWLLILSCAAWLPLEDIPFFIIAIGLFSLGCGYISSEKKPIAFAPAIIFGWWVTVLSCGLAQKGVKLFCVCTYWWV